MFLRIVYVHSYLLLVLLKCCACSDCGTEDNTLDIALVTTLNAPLKAELDISALNKQIKTLISREVQKSVKEAINDIVNSTVNTRIQEAEQKLETDITQTVLSAVEILKQVILEQRIQEAEQKLETDITETVLSAVEILKQDIRNVPAFTAILSKDFTSPVNQIIIFDSVKTNNGGHYSGKTGIFTVPKPGLYTFSATVRSGGSTHLHCELMVNDTMFVKIHGYHSNAGTSNAVLQLRTGDRVFVRKDFRSREKMLGRFWSMFSGNLIA